MKIAAAIPTISSPSEQEAIKVLVRMWLLECGGHGQDPSHAGNQPDEEKRLGGDLVVHQDGPKGGGDLGDDEDHQDTVEDQDAALQRGDLVGCGLHDFLYAADHDQDGSRHQ